MVLQLFKKQGDSRHFVGLTLHKTGCAVALLHLSVNNEITVLKADWVDFSAGQDFISEIASIVKKHHLKGFKTTLILPENSYNLLQLESLDLPEDELNDALRWRIKDMVDFSVEDTVVDSFNLPKSKRPGAPSLIYTVATQQSKVNELVEAARHAGLNVVAIDIPEMALRDLVVSSVENDRFQSYLYLHEGIGLIEICKGDEIHLTRNIPLEVSLMTASEEVISQHMESLSLEMQRSLDYFESQYAIGSVDYLHVLSESEVVEKAFIHMATTYLTVPVKSLSLTHLNGLDKYNDLTLRRSYGAIGAAMREMPCVE